jgi:uncharacterized protein (DUF983 family)
VNVSRAQIARRCLLLRCPNCGARGQRRTWFRLHPKCPQCGLVHSQEDGFTLGTTSIGYVVAFLFIVLPLCILVVKNDLSVWLGVTLGILGSVILSIGLYPFFLGWVLLTYYVVNAPDLPANRPGSRP